MFSWFGACLIKQRDNSTGLCCHADMRLSCDTHRPCDVNEKLSAPKFISGHRLSYEDSSCEEDSWRQFTDYPNMKVALAVTE
jgi:hypothetical protein